MTVRIQVSLSAACALTLLLALLPHAAPVQAATFTVTTTTDAPHSAPLDGNCTSTLPGNPCTLRAAIQAANFLSGQHTIVLAPGTYTLTVTGAGEDNAATGDLDLNNVNINLVSPGGVNIDGNGTDRVFDVGPIAPAQLTLSRMLIRNGVAGTSPFAASDIGGGIRLSRNSSATVTQSALVGNRAGNRGGAIGFSTVGTAGTGSLTLDGVEMQANRAGTEGGTLAINQPTTLNNVGIRTSTVTGTTGAERGGAIASSATLTYTLGEVDDNSVAAGLGGGISSGGPADAPPARLTIDNVLFRRNRALGGGGVANLGVATVNNATFTENTATSTGGVTLNVMGMMVAGLGGGLATQGPATLTNVTFTGNVSGDIDGGLAVIGAQTTLTNGVFTGNRATRINGGVGSGPGTTLAMTDVSINGNTAAINGGYGNQGTATLTNVTVSGNTASNLNGGIGNQGTLNLTNVTISGNTAATRGGGLGNDGGGSSNLTNVTIAANAAPSGSGIFTEPPAVTTVRNMIVVSNAASGNCAGPVVSAGDNISNDNTCNLGGPGDRNNVDPRLGPLADNGGPRLGAPEAQSPTLTHALQPGSPAIDAVLNNPCPPPATDQRGIPRPQGARCDIGAFEAAAGTPGAATATPQRTATATPQRTATATPTPPAVNNVAQITASLRPDGQPVPCADSLGDPPCQITGRVTGTARVAGPQGMTVTVSVPAGVIPAGAVANVFVSTTRGIESFACPAAVAGTVTTCTGTTLGLLLQGSTVRVFAGGVSVATGTISGAGAQGAQGPPPPIMLPPLPPPIVPLLPSQSGSGQALESMETMGQVPASMAPVAAAEMPMAVPEALPTMTPTPTAVPTPVMSRTGTGLPAESAAAVPSGTAAGAPLTWPLGAAGEPPSSAPAGGLTGTPPTAPMAGSDGREAGPAGATSEPGDGVPISRQASGGEGGGAALESTADALPVAPAAEPLGDGPVAE